MKILTGHESAETAYVIDDYPYGFRLRCQIRYWLDTSPKRGTRLISQTSNPKKPGLVWNKPKYSTYSMFGGCMFLDENEHVQWAGLNEYSDLKEAISFRDTYREGIPDAIRPKLDNWIKTKEIYETKLAAGMDFQQAGRETTIECVKSGITI